MHSRRIYSGILKANCKESADQKAISFHYLPDKVNAAKKIGELISKVDEASIALVLYQLPPEIEKELSGDTCMDSLINLDIKACYFAFLNDALMKKKELISSQLCDIMELQPILEEIIEQQK